MYLDTCAIFEEINSKLFEYMLLQTLQDIHADRKQHKKDTYRAILRLAKERVLFYARGRGSDTNTFFCIYTVPVWLPNRPLYDANKAATYVMKKLVKKEGLNVTKIAPNQLYISWEDTATPTTVAVPSQSTMLFNLL